MIMPLAFRAAAIRFCGNDSAAAFRFGFDRCSDVGTPWPRPGIAFIKSWVNGEWQKEPYLPIRRIKIMPPMTRFLLSGATGGMLKSCFQPFVLTPAERARMSQHYFSATLPARAIT
jgi:hypothetical protein